VWVRDRFVPYPFQCNLHRLPEADLDAGLTGLEAAVAAARHHETPPAHFGEWIDRTFGDGVARLFMRPYNRKVWAREPELMDWRWVGDRVAVPDLTRIRENVRLRRDDVSWGPNNRFRFPRRGGTGAVWQALAARLSRADGPGAARIRLGTRLRFLDTVAHRVTTADGQEIGYDALISTMPLDRLVAASDLARDLRRVCQDLEHSSTHVIGIGLTGAPPSALDGKCWMYFPEDAYPFYRVTHFSHYSPNNVPDPATQWSLMAEVSESSHRPVDHDAVVGDTVAALSAAGFIHDSQVHHTWHTRLPYGYPVPSLRRDRALDVIHSTLELRDVYSRGRFGAWKYEVSNQDHSLAQGVEVVDALTAGAEETTLRHPDVVNARRPGSPSVSRG
jgi:protoporphyrinogen oxidase